MKRIRKSTIPISDLTAETVAADGLALRQADHTDVMQRFFRAYCADDMVLVATDCGNNTLVAQCTYSYDTLGRPLTRSTARKDPIKGTSSGAVYGMGTGMRISAHGRAGVDGKLEIA